MLYLSDDIFVNIRLSDNGYIGKYINYFIRVCQTLDPSQSEDVMTGRLFYSESGLKLNLNDIASTYVNNRDYISPNNLINNIPKPLNDNPVVTGILQFIEVHIVETGDVFSTDNILSYYKDTNIKRGENIDITNTNPKLYNVLKQRTNIIPRVPKLPYTTNNFWISYLLFPSQGFLNKSIYDDEPYYVIGSFMRNAGETFNSNFYISDIYAPISYNLTGDDYSDLTDNGDYIFIRNYKATSITLTNYELIATIDKCPADYYLIWMDRTGAYQCQPFNKRVDYQESIKTDNITNNYNIVRPYRKDVQSKWVLNSDWLTEEQYKAYESILVSPYIYLFDTKNDMGWWVNCNMESYTDQKYKNGKKLFNMNIKVESNSQQNILY